MVLTKDKNTLYGCSATDSYIISKYMKNKESKEWEKIEDLPKAENDGKEEILQLKLDKHDKILFGKIIT